MTSADATAQRLLDVVYAVASERDNDTVLRRVLDAGRELTGARYAAVGVPDGGGGFGTFVTSGISDEQWDAIGELPRQHGLLASLLADPTPVRLRDIRRDPRFSGWPRAHPAMRSFLGVPVVAGGEILAELYLADKTDGTDFTDDDQRLTETLAAHAALAVANAQRLDRSRELSVATERNRLARDLHDSVTQTLFSLSLAAESAALGDARQLDEVRALAAQSQAEMRSLVQTLRAPDLHRDGLAATLRSRVELLRRVHGPALGLITSGRERPRHREIEPELMAVATEAMSNALQHADARTVTVTLDVGEVVRLEVRDDGGGFDTSAASRGLGVTSMRDRTQGIGGTFSLTSSPAGTGVTVEVPDA